MKAARFKLIRIVVLCFLVWLPDTSSARTSISVRLGGGSQRFNRGNRSGYRWDSRGHSHYKRYSKSVGHNWRWRTYRPCVVKPIVVSSGYWYYREPDYYVVTSQPQVIERQVVVVQPSEEDEDTQALYEALRYRKSELLKELRLGNKEQRIEAIDELAGFSFDDQVRQALESVLLSDPDPELRKEAAKAFGNVKNTKALPALEKARVEDSNEDVRKEADNAIRKIESD